MTIPPTGSTSTQLSPEQLDIHDRIQRKLITLGVNAMVTQSVSVGPVVSAYHIVPKGKTRASQVENLGEDIALALGTGEKILVQRVSDGYAAFVPNAVRRGMTFGETIGAVYTAKQAWVPPDGVFVCIGQDVLGNPVTESVENLVHFLIAGVTGSGKSTFLSAMLSTTMYAYPPDEVQFVLCDTKGVEFGVFDGGVHLAYSSRGKPFHNPANTVGETIDQLGWLVEETQIRLDEFADKRVKNIREYQSLGKKLHRIVFVIDELKDLISSEYKTAILDKLSTIVGRARASGIHVIAGTQHPSAKLLSSEIKSNFPSRLCFRVTSGVNSRVVLDECGAEHLLARGDALFMSPNRAGLVRVHSPFVEHNEFVQCTQVATQRYLGGG